jgi:hypothetical protein
MKERSKPEYWVTWLTSLMAGENSCYWAAQYKGRYQYYDKQPREDQSSLATWEVNHTALLNELIDEYMVKSQQILIEGQTKWCISGTRANITGKMDLVTIGPNTVIDAKSGEPKSSHVVQMQIYLLAIEWHAVPALKDVQGPFTGILRYPNNHDVVVDPPSESFKGRLALLINRLGDSEQFKIPSEFECNFCNIKDCDKRYVKSEEESKVLTSMF